MNRIALLLAPMLLSGCATNTEIPEYRTDRSIVSVQTNSGTTDVQLTREAAITSEVISGEDDAVWAALPRAFAELEIPVTGVDPSSRVLTSTERVRRIDGKSMSTFFNCPGPYSNIASSGDVYISLRSQVLPGAGSVTTVRHEIAAVARSSTGAITQVRCTSKGTLEKLLTETLQAQVGEA